MTKNEGENTMKVNVKLPNSLKNIWPDLEVPKHTSKRVWIFFVCVCAFSLLCYLSHLSCVMFEIFYLDMFIRLNYTDKILHSSSSFSSG